MSIISRGVETVLTAKKPHIGNTVIHPENGLHYAYYGPVATKERADKLCETFKRERQWSFIHEIPGGFNIFHRHATLEHPRQPFGKVPPKVFTSYEQAIADAQRGKPREHRQKEPGSRDVIAPAATRVVLSEQEKRARKIERRALRRMKKKETKANQVVSSVIGQLRPDLMV